jgi:hypothetical protein
LPKITTYAEIVTDIAEILTKTEPIPKSKVLTYNKAENLLAIIT